ncbi:putative protein Networked (NET), actin-binding (NAB) [Lupinus albus]|uniref:NAB domain-containing protein n=1 Tax=Lupinus albus TaxID=3870 RepID=A0A6A4PX66_LUPAL|nr:putative protein Networked (NET), actin-binding (NAB) [Lupinus albus]
MRRLETMKSHSWWWDSHISPKNSKWLSENLEQMDHHVKRMVKLIDQDADSFAKKADMYYQKRPELVALVEEFYRGYRALAERYDQVTMDLRKNVSSGLQSQGSSISDVGSESTSTRPSSVKGNRRIYGYRAAGFDYFLGSGGNGFDVYQKDGDESSTLTDSDEEFDDSSSVNNYSGFSGNGSDPGMTRRMVELENELREVKEKLWLQEEGNLEGSLSGPRVENTEDLYDKINAYEQDLMILNEKFRLSKQEITKLKSELKKCRSLDSENVEAGLDLSSTVEYITIEEIQRSCNLVDEELLEPNNEIESLGKQLRITKEKLEVSELQIASMKFEANKSSERIEKLHDQLDLAQKDTAIWKTKFNSDRKGNTKLQEIIARLKSSLVDREHEIRDLKTAVSDAECKIFPEKAKLKAEISKMLEERTRLEDEIREWECRGRAFEEDIRIILSEKIEMEEALKGEIEMLNADIETKVSCIEDLNVSVDALKLEIDNLKVKAGSLKEELNSKDDRIKYMNQLNMEHVQVIEGMEEAQTQVMELKSKVEQLKKVIEKQQSEILEGAEQKREAIRQLCFSIEHYRNNYTMLLQHFTRHK